MHMYTLFSRTLDKLQCIKTQYFILKTKIALAVENAKKTIQRVSCRLERYNLLYLCGAVYFVTVDILV